jgi:ParB family chromosome partitioning protein
MAVKKTGLGRGLDALFPEKSAQNRQKTTVKRERENVSSGVKAENKSGNKTENNSEDNTGNTPAAKTNGKIQQDNKAAQGNGGSSYDTLNPAATSNLDRVEENKEAHKPVKEEDKAVRGAEIMVKISSVEPNRDQPRKSFDEENLQELAESIKQYGILQPLLVSKKEDYYEIIAGERRWRAAKLAGVKEVPVLVKEFSDQQIVEVSLIENIQREDLNSIEEALAYKRLMDEFHLKQDEIAEKVSKSRTAVTNSIRLLKLDERVQKLLINDEISAGHARTLLGLPDGDTQFAVAQRIIEEKLSVREIERLVKNILEPPKEKEKKTVVSTTEDVIYENLEERMKRIMGTKVSINRKKNNKGKIEIEYYSRDELERIIEMFESIE